MKKILNTFLIILLSLQFILPVNLSYAAVSAQISDFLCEKGISYYDIGKYPQALIEFKKALLANPESSVARKFIDLIETEQSRPGRDKASPKKIYSIENYLDNIEVSSVLKRKLPTTDVGEFERQVVRMKSTLNSVSASGERKAQDISKNSVSAADAEIDLQQEIVININRTQEEPSFVKIEEGKDQVDVSTNVGERIILKGDNISRYLVTEPQYLKVTRQDHNTLIAEPLDVGSTNLHVWDSGVRRSFKFNIGQRRFVERLLKEANEKYAIENLPESFKVSYSIDGDSFMTGRGIGDQKRQSLNYSYSASLNGETPYGNLDSAIAGTRTDLGNYRVSNMRVGLTNGHYDQFKGFSIRALDFSPSFSAFGFPVADLRGISLDSPAFNNKLHYSSFWGALPGGDFTQLTQTSGFSPTKKAWLEGAGLSYKLSKYVNLKTFYAHSYGPERVEPVLTSDVAGFGSSYHFGGLDLNAEMAYDFLKSVSYTTTTSYTLPKLRASFSTTNNNKNFTNLLGGDAVAGSTNKTISLDYRPRQDIILSNVFSINKDEVFGNPARPGRPNYNDSARARWTIDSQTELELGYIMDDQIGTISPAVTETKEVVLRKTLYFLRKLNTFVTFQNTKSKNYNSPAQDYDNNRIMVGSSARLVYDIYGYYRQEFDFLKNKFTNETAFPTATEFGLNYNRRIFKTPFSTNIRLFYRNEERTESVLSFLSGEDRLEGEAELSFRPTPDNEAYIKLRVADVWAEKAGVAKHYDLDISWGLRLLWDTAFRWESVCGFSGYVFYDINGDGIRQPEEKGLKGAVIKANNGKTAATDTVGFYKITGLKGKQAGLTLDLRTVPKGYSPTTDVERKVDIVNASVKRVDFGLTTRTEIAGLIFKDKNSNGQYDPGEEPMSGVILILDEKTKTATSPLGEFMFRRLSPGEHNIRVDLKSIPIKYIPKVPILKAVKVLEGTTFVYNIPLAQVEEVPITPKEKK